MKQWLYKIIVLIVIMNFCVETVYSFTSQEIQSYIQLILTIDKALQQEGADASLIAVEKDIIGLIELYEEIQGSLTPAEKDLVDQCIDRLGKVVATKAPRIGAPAERAPINVDDRYFDLRDEYLRNLIITGSLIAPNFNSVQPDLDPFVLKAGDTMTGNLTFANQHGVVFDDSAANSVFIQAPTLLNTSYTMQLPVDSGISGQVLATSGGSPDQLFWTSISAVVTSSINLFGDVIGSASATVVKTVCGVPACNLVQSYSTILSGTSADSPNTLVLRDGSGSFSATTITLTGNLILENCNEIQFYNQSDTEFVGLRAPCTTISQPNTIILPATPSSAQFQVLGDIGNPQGQLGWITTLTNSNQLQLLYNATPNALANTLVLRDATGSFTSCTITATCGFYGNLTGNASTATSAITSVSSTFATNSLFSVTAQFALSAASGIQSLNGLTASNQFLTTTTAGTLVQWNQLGGNTNQLQIPYAGNLIGTTSVGLISGIDYQNFSNTNTTVLAATPLDTPNTIVKRDGTGSFAATNITLTAVIYQGQGGQLKLTATTLPGNQTLVWPTTTPQANQALFYSGNNQLSWVTTLTGGIESLNGNTAPAQFLTTTTAGTVVGFTQSGNNTNLLTIPYAGNLIGTGGVGLISGFDYQNFQNTFTTVLNASSADLPNTLVLRDGSGNFAASQITVHNILATNATNQLTLGSGPTITLNAVTPAANRIDTIPDVGTNSTFVMTDGAQTINGLKTFNNTVKMAAQNQIDFYDATTTNFVGIQAPLSVVASYTLQLPATAPIGGGQVLMTSTVAPYTSLNWAFLGSGSQNIYVSTSGSDTTGNGSFSAPFASLKRALVLANATATPATPVQIIMGAGVFKEDNSAGPLTVTATPININGASTATTILTASVTNQNFLALPVTALLRDLTIEGATGATGVVGTGANNSSVFLDVSVQNCNQGFNISGGTATEYYFYGVTEVACGTGKVINNAHAVLYNSTFIGSSSIPTAQFAGLLVTGTESVVTIEAPAFLYCTIGMEVSNGANVAMTGAVFTANTIGLQCDTQSKTTLSSSAFVFTTDKNIVVQDSGTTFQATGCNINGTSLIGIGNAEGIGLLVTNGANVDFAASVLTHLTDAIISGSSTDTTPATVLATGVTIQGSTGKDIIQTATSQFTFVGGSFRSDLITINNPGNVVFNSSDSSNDQSSIIGKFANIPQDILIVATDETVPPAFTYQNNFDSASGLVFIDSTGDTPTVLGVESTNQEARLAAITNQNNQVARLQLYSGHAGSVPPITTPNNSNLRGWELIKTGTSLTIPTAALAANFVNNDTVGSTTVTQYTAFYVDGFANTFNFPTATGAFPPTNATTVLQWAGDTNLYRASANLLKTDDEYAIGTIPLTDNTGFALTAASPSNIVQHSATTAIQLGYLSTATGDIQAQLNGKVSKSGDTMTGPLTLPDGTSSAPSLNFAGFTTTGLSAAGGLFSLDTNGNPALTINQNGNVTINQAASGTTLTVAGGGASISGNLTIPSGSGRIITDAITINNAPVAGTDGTNKAYVDSVATGLQVKAPCNVVATAPDGNITLAGFPTIDSVATSTGYRVLLTDETNGVQNGIWQINSGGMWVRPSDFPSGGSALSAYTLILSGSVYANSSWICTNTVGNATIDTNTLNWTEFSSPVNITGANVGTGAGVFQGKVGNTLDFRSLNNGGNNNIAVTQNTNDISIVLSSNLSVTSLTASGNIISTGGTVQGVTLTDGAGTTITGGTVTAINVNATNNVTASNFIANNGSALHPSISFIASSTTGFYSPAVNTVAISTSGAERLQIDGSGTIQVQNSPGFPGTAGVVHNDSSGNLSSSLIVDADITSGTITNDKLASISSLDVPSTIVLRDSNGDFVAHEIYADTSLLSASGSLTVPSISFATYPNPASGAGLSSPVANQLNLISGNKSQIILNASGTLIQLPLLTSSLPLQLNASSNIISGQINLGTGVTGVLPIANGGTNSNAALNNNRIMVSSGGAIVESAVLNNGQILIGSAGAAPVVNTIAGTTNEIIVTNGAGTITLATPQPIAQTSSPTFVNVTTTGYEIFQGPGNTTVSLGAQTLSATYTLNWPVSAPSVNQALFYNGNNQLSWVTTLTGGIESLNGNTAPVQFLTTTTAGTVVGFTQSGNNTNLLTIPYAGNLIGTTSVGLISGIDFQNFNNTFTTIGAGTSCATPNRLVQRDVNGSFEATTIGLSGASLINYSTSSCSLGTPFIEAPTSGNTIIGINAASSLSTGSNNTVYGNGAGSTLTTGSNNIYLGAHAGAGHQGNNSIFLGNTQTYTGDNVIFIGNPSNSTVTNCTPNSATTTTIYGCINLPEVNCGTGYIASFDTTGQLVKASSSRKYKDNIDSLNQELSDRVYQLRPVKFNFKNSPHTQAYGLIAEEAHESCPEIVIYNAQGEPDSVNYLSTQILALDALINLNKRCDALTEMVERQNMVIENLQLQIQKLIQ
jgi:hypothetical protein